MNNIHDSIGVTFNRLTLIEPHGKRGRRNMGLFVCTCGTKHVAEFSAVACGRTMSCGCLSKEVSAATGRKSRTHGMFGSVEYNIWSKIIQRCTNKSNKSYRDYGGRGISICDRWLSFSHFHEDMGHRPDASYSIGRIDNDGDYTRDNCRWETVYEQSRNKRNTVWVETERGIEVLQDAVAASGISRETVKSRVTRGMSIEDALTIPSRKVARTTRGALIEFNGLNKTASEWATHLGIGLKTLLYRLHAGWPHARALTPTLRGQKETSESIADNLIQL